MSLFKSCRFLTDHGYALRPRGEIVHNLPALANRISAVGGKWVLYDTLNPDIQDAYVAVGNSFNALVAHACEVMPDSGSEPWAV